MFLMAAYVAVMTTFTSPSGDFPRDSHYRGPEGREAHSYEPTEASSSKRLTVYVHGHGANVEIAWFEHDISGQFKTSNVSGSLVIAGGSTRRGDKPKWRSLKELREVFGFPDVPTTLIVHSGGCSTAKRFVNDVSVDRLIMLDALYCGDVWISRFLDRGGKVLLVSAATKRKAAAFMAKDGRATNWCMPRRRGAHMGIVTWRDTIPRALKYMEGME